SGSTRVFFETPCVEWILRGQVMWDFFYEHCSIFTAHSLGLALARAGFGVTGVRHVFGGQYLWAEGCAGGDPSPLPPPRGEGEKTEEGCLSPPSLSGKGAGGLGLLARAFGAVERQRVAGWRATLDELRDGPVFAWGAGAKGVTFCNLADPDATRLAGVVDVNPAKEGKFLPGTRHAVVPPEAAGAAAAVPLVDPDYAGEVTGPLARLGSRAAVIDLSRPGVSHAAHH